ncbi:hypothetical protein Tco_0851410 [Tanacetum coccineum]
MGIYGSKLKACGDEFRNQHAIAVAAAEYETKVVAILVRNNNGDKVSLESMRTLHGSYHASRIHVVERSRGCGKPNPYKARLSLGGAVVSGHIGKFRAKVVRRQMDPLDSLTRSALARDAEYDHISEDDFGTATRGEEIHLTLFPLIPGPYQMSYLYEGASSPHILKRSGMVVMHRRIISCVRICLRIRTDLLVSHGAELNSRYTGLVTTRNHLQEKFVQKAGYVKENSELRSQKDVTSDKVKELYTKLTDAKVASIGLSEELSQTDAKLSDQALVMRDLHNQLVLE